MSRRTLYTNTDEEFIPALNADMDTLYRRVGKLEKRRQVIEASVGTGETEIRHKLGRVATIRSILPHADSRVWRTKPPTDKAVFLRASAAVTVTVEVEG